MMTGIDFNQASDEEMSNYIDSCAWFIKEEMDKVDRVQKPLAYDNCIQGYILTQKALGVDSGDIHKQVQQIHKNVMQILLDENEHLATDTRQ